MRFGYWKATICVLVLGGALGSSARANDPFAQYRAIPRTAQAIDLRTGQPMYAPPVPYGHYAKDPLGHVAGAAGLVHGLFGKVKGLHGLCGLCKGNGCNTCGGTGMTGPADGCGDAGCGSCAGKGGVFATGFDNGAGHGHGKKGLFGHGLLPSGHSNAVVGNGGLPVGGGHHGGFGHHDGAIASPQSAAPYPTSQVLPAPQGCGNNGCSLKHGLGGGLCGNKLGNGLCGDKHGNNPCGDKGCGLFGGKGLGHGGPGMSACGGCGGQGCGLCNGLGGLCNNCGGAGCGLCANLKGKIHGLLGGLLPFGGHGVKYFTGAGGPVPITPGYVPYVVTTRSPRDFFAFPPYGNGVSPDY